MIANSIPRTYEFPVSDSPVPTIDPRDAVTSTLRKVLEDVLAETLFKVQAQTLTAHRVWQGLETYLDSCLRRPSIRVLIAAVHGYEPAWEMQCRCTAAHIKILEVDLQDLRVPIASDHAQLIVAMVREIQLAEQDDRCVLPSYRDSLKQHVMRLCI